MSRQFSASTKEKLIEIHNKLEAEVTQAQIEGADATHVTAIKKMIEICRLRFIDSTSINTSLPSKAMLAHWYLRPQLRQLGPDWVPVTPPTLQLNEGQHNLAIAYFEFFQSLLQLHASSNQEASIDLNDKNLLNELFCKYARDNIAYILSDTADILQRSEFHDRYTGLMDIATRGQIDVLNVNMQIAHSDPARVRRLQNQFEEITTNLTASSQCKGKPLNRNIRSLAIVNQHLQRTQNVQSAIILPSLKDLERKLTLLHNQVIANADPVTCVKALCAKFDTINSSVSSTTYDLATPWANQALRLQVYYHNFQHLKKTDKPSLLSKTLDHYINLRQATHPKNRENALSALKALPPLPLVTQLNQLMVSIQQLHLCMMDQTKLPTEQDFILVNSSSLVDSDTQTIHHIDHLPTRLPIIYYRAQAVLEIILSASKSELASHFGTITPLLALTELKTQATTEKAYYLEISDKLDELERLEASIDSLTIQAASEIDLSAISDYCHRYSQTTLTDYLRERLDVVQRKFTAHNNRHALYIQMRQNFTDHHVWAGLQNAQASLESMRDDPVHINNKHLMIGFIVNAIPFAEPYRKITSGSASPTDLMQFWQLLSEYQSPATSVVIDVIKKRCSHHFNINSENLNAMVELYHKTRKPRLAIWRALSAIKYRFFTTITALTKSETSLVDALKSPAETAKQSLIQQVAIEISHSSAYIQYKVDDAHYKDQLTQQINRPIMDSPSIWFLMLNRLRNFFGRANTETEAWRCYRWLVTSKCLLHKKGQYNDCADKINQLQIKVTAVESLIRIRDRFNTTAMPVNHAECDSHLQALVEDDQTTLAFKANFMQWRGCVQQSLAPNLNEVPVPDTAPQVVTMTSHSAPIPQRPSGVIHDDTTIPKGQGNIKQYTDLKKEVSLLERDCNELTKYLAWSYSHVGNITRGLNFASFFYYGGVQSRIDRFNKKFYLLKKKICDSTELEASHQTELIALISVLDPAVFYQVQSTYPRLDETNKQMEKLLQQGEFSPHTLAGNLLQATTTLFGTPLPLLQTKLEQTRRLVCLFDRAPISPHASTDSPSSDFPRVLSLRRLSEGSNWGRVMYASELYRDPVYHTYRANCPSHW